MIATESDYSFFEGVGVDRQTLNVLLDVFGSTATDDDEDFYDSDIDWSRVELDDSGTVPILR